MCCYAKRVFVIMYVYNICTILNAIYYKVLFKGNYSCNFVN